MDTSTIAVVIAAVSAIVSVVSALSNQKKNNNDDGLKLGEFMGEIRTDIKNIKETIQSIKDNHAEDRDAMNDAIKWAITEHEKIYHGKEHI